MYYLGYTLNNMTMLGLILAIGIVIDDSVVIHENIFRHMEEYGRKGREAASTATREIALAVMATTMSLLVIFLPVVFMAGRVGQFFSSFGATVAFAIFMSLCISFTMTPMLCSQFLVMKPGHAGSKANWVWRAVDGFYGWLLGWSLRHRWLIVLCCVALVPITVGLFRIIGFDFVPRDDQSEFEVAITMPEGYTLDRAEQLFSEIEGRLKGLRGVTDVFSTIGDTTGRITRGQGDVTAGTIYARMVDLEKRQRTLYDSGFWANAFAGRQENNAQHFTQFDIQDDARQIMKEYPDLRVAVQDVSLFAAAGMRQATIEFCLRGPNLEKLQEYSEQVMRWMKQQRFNGQPSYVDVDNSLSMRKPELRVKIDRERASDLGIPVQAIATTLNVLVGGEPVSKYKETDEQYDVWLRRSFLSARTRNRFAA